MARDEAEPPEYCPNCDAAVHGPYCAQCGQETVHELPTFKRVHEGRWWPQIVRGLLLGSGYAVLSSVVIGVLMLASSGVQLRLH